MTEPRPIGVIPAITFSDTAGMIEAMRTIKNYLELSNSTVDTLCGFTPGHTDKLLGPTNAKRFSALSWNALIWCLASTCTITIDIEKAKAMAEHWEKRDASRYRPNASVISKVILKRAEPIIMRENGRKGGLASVRKRSGSLVEDCRRAGKARMRRLTRKQRSELARKAGIASAAKRSALRT